MKNLYRKLSVPVRIVSFAAVLLSALSCELSGISSSSAEGGLRICFASDQDILTRSGIDIPDTSDFILTVKDSKGKVMYEGTFGASPQTMSLKSGSYTVNIISEEFGKPAFSAPQFGDEQCVVVSSGEITDVRLVCTQINCGIRLHIDPAFLDRYPDGAFLLKSSFGRLLYSYSEKRIAYFKPGNISLILADNGADDVLMTKTLQAQEILELKVKVSESEDTSQNHASKGITVSLDTTRTWLSDEYVLGGKSGGSDVLSVMQALSMGMEEGVNVYGYIVGGDLTSSSASFTRPFSSRTNIVIGPRSSTDRKSECLSVQLPSGDIRDALNLVDNPHLLGRKVCLRGDIVEAYYGIPGIKNISEYELQ